MDYIYILMATVLLAVEFAFSKKYQAAEEGKIVGMLPSLTPTSRCPPRWPYICYTKLWT